MPTSPPLPVDDPLALAPLFEGGGEGWGRLLSPLIERDPRAARYIGPQRASGIVPVRELTFQALKPNPPEGWRVVVFGQNPYPRVESATGIAMFDNTIDAWSSGRFGRVTSMRCIIKAACMWRHGVDAKTPVSKLRALMAREETVGPPEWFESVLAQGVLLLNASLTADALDANALEAHARFWRPVIERVVEAILEARAAGAGPTQRGVVFAWWGQHARALRPMVERVARRFPRARVRHVDHCNPAAMRDAFCDGDPLGRINDALRDVGARPVDWLPSRGWRAAVSDEDAARMGAFIADTVDLHAKLVERLQDVVDERLEPLAPITGVLDGATTTLAEALAPARGVVAGLERLVEAATRQGRLKALGGLGEEEAGALYLYTMGSPLYRRLNAALRDPDRAAVRPFAGYLRLLFAAIGRLEARPVTLWRGVAADLRAFYPKGKGVTWWGASSCTPSLGVARGFVGRRGQRTLFEVRAQSAVSIQGLSAYPGEEEYLLAPGARLEVVQVRSEGRSLHVVELVERPGERPIS